MRHTLSRPVPGHADAQVGKHCSDAPVGSPCPNPIAIGRS